MISNSKWHAKHPFSGQNTKYMGHFWFPSWMILDVLDMEGSGHLCVFYQGPWLHTYLFKIIFSFCHILLFDIENLVISAANISLVLNSTLKFFIYFMLSPGEGYFMNDITKIWPKFDTLPFIQCHLVSAHPHSSFVTSFLNVY